VVGSIGDLSKVQLQTYDGQLGKPKQDWTGNGLPIQQLQEQADHEAGLELRSVGKDAQARQVAD
jgi:hypothetical protein